MKNTVTVWLTRNDECEVCDLWIGGERPQYDQPLCPTWDRPYDKTRGCSVTSILPISAQRIFKARMKGGPKSIRKYKVTIESVED